LIRLDLYWHYSSRWVALAGAQARRYDTPEPKGQTMTEADAPQLYLVTPPAFDPAPFGDVLAAVLDAVPVACLRLSLATQDEDALARAADTLREVAHARDVAIVIAQHLQLVERLGLDGVHFDDGARKVRKARTALGADAIVGAYCGASRHEGMTAAEAGADYVAFGPVGETVLGDGTRAPRELFEFWSEAIEVPCVAEGALGIDDTAGIAAITDFIALGEEIWQAPDPAARLRDYIAALRG
jgi:thiamine-phosphate pyrophosphorylase